MPQELKGNAITIRTGVESWVINHPDWFELIHDGSQIGDGRRSFFTKMYALKRNGKAIGVGVKFTYDYRTGLAAVELDDVVVKMMEESSKEFEMSQVSAFDKTRRRFNIGILIGLAFILIGVASIAKYEVGGYSSIICGVAIDVIFQFQLSKLDKLDRDTIINNQKIKLEEHDNLILENAITNIHTKKGVI